MQSSALSLQPDKKINNSIAEHLNLYVASRFMRQKTKKKHQTQSKSKLRQKVRVIYVFDVDDRTLNKKLVSQGSNVNTLSLSRQKINKINSILLEGIQQQCSHHQGYKNIRFTLLNRKIAGIKADAFSRLELQKGSYHFKAYQMTILMLLIRLWHKGRYRQLAYAFQLLKKIDSSK